MNRSNHTIPWGFNVTGGESVPIKICSIQKESLAEKAGLQVNDIVVEFSGRSTEGMSLQEGKNYIEKTSSEIRMVLQRHITEHPCLPWQLTSNGNDVTIDYIKPETAVNYNSYERNTNSRPLIPNYQPLPFTNVTNTKVKFSDKMNENEKDRNRNYTDNITRMESTHASNVNKFGSGSGTSRNVPIAIANSVSSSTVAKPFSVLQKDDTTTNGPKNYNLVNTESRKSLQHLPRTERKLFPDASVRHLQYNSPINLYTPHAAAEQYQQQTGRFISNDPLLRVPKKTESYLQSETRRLIAEEEGQSTHEKAPSMQSASFKRISRACGTPVD
ncbi:unnamed protein product [Thelazia callipaeda]|uniref:PDZ domain-containing protein n=1 Tax=Thelazia callipaeda TaxID=103827 RepID=A0A0N5CQR9_THECL|nr:unnamed protein product [Thelazia callipaeda]